MAKLTRFFSFSVPAECEQEEIMDNPSVIGDDQIKDCQENDKPAAEAKPGRSGYVKPVPEDATSSDKPCLKVVLTSDSSPEPKVVSKVIVAGNVKAVTVLKKEGKEEDSPFVPVLKEADVGEDGVVLLPTPEKMAELKVILEKPKEEDAETYNTTLKVHACGNFSREYGFLVLFLCRCPKEITAIHPALGVFSHHITSHPISILQIPPPWSQARALSRLRC